MRWILHHNHKAQWNSQSQINALSEESWVSDFVEALPDSITVCIKDAHTGKYLLANTTQAKLCGLESVNDLIGTSFREYWIEDVFHRKEKFHLSDVVLLWEKEAVKEAEQREVQVCSTQAPLSINHAILELSGFIRWEHLKKLPILDSNKEKVIATLTLTEDLTSQMHLLDLFQLYRHYYSDQTAVEYLSKYLQIDHYFTRLPTVKEMQIMLAMHHHPSRKRIARHLNISHNTVASHIQHMKEKLLVPDYHEVLMQLRKAPRGKNSNYFNPVCVPESA